MRRRGAGNGRPPQHLMRFRVEDWPDPGPEPKWWAAWEADEGIPWRVHQADIEWSRARLRWVRLNARSLDDINALFDPELGYEPPPAEDPRRAAEIDMDLILALPGRRLGGKPKMHSWQDGVLKAIPAVDHAGVRIAAGHLSGETAQ